jgi:hypothetical protein
MQTFQLLANFRPGNTRRRLWLAGGALGLFLLTLVVGNAFIPRDKAVTREMLGHDFLAFYTAGSFVGQGRYHDLYNLDAVKAFEQAASRAAGLEVGSSFGPWWNPPFYDLMFAPLAKLPYGTALDAWRWIGLIAILISTTILTQFVARASRPCLATSDAGETPGLQDWRSWALVPLLVLISMPFLQAISHGQNTFTSLLLLVTTVTLWRNERAWLAGLSAGLLFYKPQLAAVVAAALVFDLGWRALGGLCITGAALLLVTIVTMPGAIGDYLHLLPANVRWMQIEHAYLWERHVTLKAFWRLLLQGREAGEPWIVTTVLTYLSLAGIGGALVWAAVGTHWKKDRGHGPRLYRGDVQRDRLISATIAVMPLLMPFYFDYDLLLLSVPATLYAAERVRRPDLARANDVWLTRSWVALFLWLFVNPALAMRTHVNITVVLLTCVASLLIARARRAEAHATLTACTPADASARALAA